eukprot:403333555
MMSYKAIGVVSPIIIYGLSDKLNMPENMTLPFKFMKQRSQEEKIGLLMDSDRSNKVNDFLMTNGLKELMLQYNPPSICQIPLVSILLGLSAESKHKTIEFSREYINCDVKGSYTIDYCELKQAFTADLSQINKVAKKKIMFVVPGVTGCSEEPYIKDLCGAALQNGYIPVVLNHCATKDEEMNQRVLDMGDSDHHHDTCMKAAISVSNPFDVIATTIRLKYKFFGIYDRAIREMLARPFLLKKFKLHQESFGEEWLKQASKYKSLFEFDNHVRAKILGYNSIQSLYRNVSCDRFVSNINVPFLVLHSQDDPICPTTQIPYDDLLRNPNVMIIQTKIGGHCDFFNKIPGKFFKVYRFYPEIIMKYFADVQQFQENQQSSKII